MQATLGLLRCTVTSIKAVQVPLMLAASTSHVRCRRCCWPQIARPHQPRPPETDLSAAPLSRLQHSQECLHFVRCLARHGENQNVVDVNAIVLPLRHQAPLFNALLERPSVLLPSTPAAASMLMVVFCLVAVCVQGAHQGFDRSGPALLPPIHFTCNSQALHP